MHVGAGKIVEYLPPYPPTREGLNLKVQVGVWIEKKDRHQTVRRLISLTLLRNYIILPYSNITCQILGSEVC